MSIAKDPFLSWPMVSARRSEWAQPPNADVRYSFFQARNAIYHSLHVLGIRKRSRVLAPSYICRAAIDPLLAYDVDVDFYAVRRDCLIDTQDLEARITPETSAILVVHYFGFPQPLRRIKAVCDRYRIALIEDCAHVLAGEVEGAPMGSVGDAAVFSWRKFLPIYDGADLVINRRGQFPHIRCSHESPLFTMKVGANMIEAGLVQARQPLLQMAHGGFRALESAFRKLTNGRLRRAPMMQAETTADSFDVKSVHWPMSRISRLTKSHSDIPRIVEKRRQNYQMLAAELSSIPRFTPLVPKLPDGVCPWIFPLSFAGLKNAHLSLRDRGIPAVTWGGVRHPEIRLGAFQDSDFLYDNLVFLPVHQCLRYEDVVEMARTVKECCSDSALPRLA